MGSHVPKSQRIAHLKRTKAEVAETKLSSSNLGPQTGSADLRNEQLADLSVFQMTSELPQAHFYVTANDERREAVRIPKRERNHATKKANDTLNDVYNRVERCLHSLAVSNTPITLRNVKVELHILRHAAESITRTTDSINKRKQELYPLLDLLESQLADLEEEVSPDSRPLCYDSCTFFFFCF